MRVNPDLLSGLNRFASEVWGNPQALIKRLPPQDVEFVDLGEHFRVLNHISANIFQHPKVLVRDEYHAVLEALQTNRYRRGTYVTGQPGIGKTYFLIYALVYFLGKREPVALQHLGGLPSYFLFKDNVDVYHIDDDVPLSEYSFVWALSDSNAHIQIPPGAFLVDANRIRIIQTTQPEVSRYKEWSKQYRASCYVMDIWTVEEIENLAMLLELNGVERILTLARKWGTVPRTLLRLMDEQDEYTESWYRGLAWTAVKKCDVLVFQASHLDLPPEGPSPFYFVRPLKTVTGGVMRHYPSVTVPTRTLREILGEGLRWQDNQTKLRFYKSLSRYAETRPTAGFIYESWFHCFILAGNEVRCQWIAQGSHRATTQLPVTVRGTSVLTRATMNVLATERPPYYWIPPHINFPGIDSVLVLENQIFAFQVTINSGHRSPIDGMEMVRNHLPSQFKKVRWRVVFVGAEENSIKKVAEHWAGQLYFPTAQVVPIAWSKVDPILDDVTYETYRDEEMMAVDQE